MRHMYDLHASKMQYCPNISWDEHPCCLKHHKQARQCILNLRFNEHDWQHRPSCFKKGCECQNNLPAALSPNHSIMFDESKPVTFHDFNGSSTTVHPFLVLPQRLQGDSFLNTHNYYTTSIFSCNKNVQIGDAGHMFYVTLYTSKNNQKEEKIAYLNNATSISRKFIDRKQ